MAWREQLSWSMKELRILLCQTPPSSSYTRVFVEKNYKELKTLNPKLPILIRECSRIEPQLWARYGISTLPALSDVIFCSLPHFTLVFKGFFLFFCFSLSVYTVCVSLCVF